MAPTKPAARYKLLLVILSVALALALCEWGLRLAFREPSALSLLRGDNFRQLYFVPDPHVGIVRRPNLDFYFRFEERPSGYIHFQTNNLGLRRVPPTELEKRNGCRIIVLGDSQVDGAVDNRENLCRLLEDKLNGGTVAYEVLNAATGSYSPYQSYLWHVYHGALLKPDLIFFTVFLGNDLAELVAPGRPRLVPGKGTFKAVSATSEFQTRMQIQQNPGGWSRLDFFLLQHSVLYGRLMLWASSRSPVPSGPLGQAYQACIGCTGQSLGQIHWLQENDMVEQSLMALDEILRRFSVESRQQKARLVLTILPSRLLVEPGFDQTRIREVARILNLDSSALSLELELLDRVEALGRKHGLPVLNLYPGLAEVHRRTSEPLYYQTDWHLNSFGHQVLADLFQRFVQDNLRVGGKRSTYPAF